MITLDVLSKGAPSGNVPLEVTCLMDLEIHNFIGWELILNKCHFVLYRLCCNSRFSKQ